MTDVTAATAAAEPDAAADDRTRGTWTDESGQVWNMRCTVRTMEELATQLKITTEAIFMGETFKAFGDDYLFAFKAIYLICKRQCDDRTPPLDSEALSDLLLGDFLADAICGAVEAITDFFPPEKRKVLTALWEKTRQVEQMATSLASQKINGPKATKAIEAAMSKAEQICDNALDELTTHPLISQDTSASTPGSTPSEN